MVGPPRLFLTRKRKRLGHLTMAQARIERAFPAEIVRQTQRWVRTTATGFLAHTVELNRTAKDWPTLHVSIQDCCQHRAECVPLKAGKKRRNPSVDPANMIREFAVEPPGATRWLIRHAVPGGYVIWWLIRWRGENFC
jgi:hypothetical protein